MLEVAFNELSLLEQADSKDHASRIYADFFKLVDAINALKIAPVRVRTSKDISNVNISYEYYTVKEWLKAFSNEERQRYLGYIAQQPVIIDNPYFRYNGTDVTGLGYAFINDLVAVSYSTNNVWVEEYYELQRDYLPSADSDVITDIVTVNHCVFSGDEVAHSKWINETFQAKQIFAAKTLQDFDSFWQNKATMFPFLDFADVVNTQIRQFESVNDAQFRKAVKYLLSLNQHLSVTYTDAENVNKIPGDVSNDGETTMNQYSAERTFTCPDGIERSFSLHVKLGDVRIYLLPSASVGKYLIGYIGKHLRTKKFNK